MRTANPLIGFIQSIKQLNDRFDTDQFIFCFDYGRLKREDLLPGYKDRSDVDDSMKEMRIEAKTQIEVLRRSLLTKWGFANQFCQRGYEADDIMASVVLNNFQDPEREAVIVSADHDLYQLLQDNVLVYDPNQKKLTSAETFRRQWNIEPEQWPYVKAIAGCTSDKVPGLKGIGEKTAAQFIAGSLGMHTKKYATIADSSEAEMLERLRLVRLPFEGTNDFVLRRQDEVDWRKITNYGATL